MERSKYLIALLVFFLAPLQLKADTKSEVYQAYITSDMAKWKLAMDELDLVPNKSNFLVLELVNYQYGYIAWCLGNHKEELAEDYLAKADMNLKVLSALEPNLSLINSYRSAFYGFRIAISPYKAPFYGPKSVDCANLAISQDNQNPYGYLQYGNAQYYMPSVFGGSKVVAIKYFVKAQKLMEVNMAELIENWNYLSVLSMIAKAYMELGNFMEAQNYYEKVLTVEPNFLWVKNSLYPELLKKIKYER